MTVSLSKCCAEENLYVQLMKGCLCIQLLCVLSVCVCVSVCAFCGQTFIDAFKASKSIIDAFYNLHVFGPSLCSLLLHFSPHWIHSLPLFPSLILFPPSVLSSSSLLSPSFSVYRCELLCGSYCDAGKSCFSGACATCRFSWKCVRVWTAGSLCVVSGLSAADKHQLHKLVASRWACPGFAQKKYRLKHTWTHTTRGSASSIYWTHIAQRVRSWHNES